MSSHPIDTAFLNAADIFPLGYESFTSISFFNNAIRATQLFYVCRFESDDCKICWPPHAWSTWTSFSKSGLRMTRSLERAKKNMEKTKTNFGAKVDALSPPNSDVASDSKV
jgi:hypothetical protein